MIITPIQLRWSDFDVLRHVYNGQYAQFFDLGKTEYFELVLKVDNNWINTREGLITASVAINYFSAIELEDTVEVRTRIEKIGNKSFGVFQEIRHTETNELKADCRTTMVGYNPLDKTTFVIPEKWRNAIAEEDNMK